MSGTTPPQPRAQRTAKRLSRAELHAEWRELMKADAATSRLGSDASPGKFDLNLDGSFEIPAVNPRCGSWRAYVARELGRLLPAGAFLRRDWRFARNGREEYAANVRDFKCFDDERGHALRSSNALGDGAQL